MVKYSKVEELLCPLCNERLKLYPHTVFGDRTLMCKKHKDIYRYFPERDETMTFVREGIKHETGRMFKGKVLKEMILTQIKRLNNGKI